MNKEHKDELKSYEYYEKELEKIISELEEGKIDTLDKLIENYEYGSQAIEKCEKILREAEVRIQKIARKDLNVNA